MKILLIDVDRKGIPNLALMKLSSWMKSKGHEVGFDIDNPKSIMVSKVFGNGGPNFKHLYPKAQIIYGGSAYDVNEKLPERIEKVKPDYDLYPSEYSQGFTTRGCFRDCPFCIVPRKEGQLKPHQHPEEFHDDRFQTCYIMDNNILGSPSEWWKSVFSWFIDQGVIMRADQGFDIRILNKEMAGYLKDIKIQNLKFAWDNPNEEEQIQNGIQLLKEVGIRLRNVQFFVLTNFNTTLEEDLYRCSKLKEWGTNPYIMIFEKEKAPKILRKLQRWANRKHFFWSGPFSEYKQLSINEKAIVQGVMA